MWWQRWQVVNCSLRCVHTTVIPNHYLYCATSGNKKPPWSVIRKHIYTVEAEHGLSDTTILAWIHVYSQIILISRSVIIFLEFPQIFHKFPLFPVWKMRKSFSSFSVISRVAENRSENIQTFCHDKVFQFCYVCTRSGLWSDGGEPEPWPHRFDTFWVKTVTQNRPGGQPRGWARTRLKQWSLEQQILSRSGKKIDRNNWYSKKDI